MTTNPEIIDPRESETEAFIAFQAEVSRKVIDAQVVKTELAHRQIERINIHGLEVVASTDQRVRDIIDRHGADPEGRKQIEEFGRIVMELTKRQIHAASLLASRRIYDEIDRSMSPHAIGNIESVVDRYLRDKKR